MPRALALIFLSLLRALLLHLLGVVLILALSERGPGLVDGSGCGSGFGHDDDAVSVCFANIALANCGLKMTRRKKAYSLPCRLHTKLYVQDLYCFLVPFRSTIDRLARTVQETMVTLPHGLLICACRC